MGNRTKTMETATCTCWLELRNERGDTLVEWATSRKYKIMNTTFQKKAGRGWRWNSPNGVTETEINYILINRTDVDTDVTVINQVNIGSDHRLVLVLRNIKLDVEVERKNLMTKWTLRVDANANRIKEDRIPSRIDTDSRYCKN